MGDLEREAETIIDGLRTTVQALRDQIYVQDREIERLRADLKRERDLNKDSIDKVAREREQAEARLREAGALIGEMSMALKTEDPRYQRAVEFVISVAAAQPEERLAFKPPLDPAVLIEWYRNDAAFHALVDSLVVQRLAAAKPEEPCKQSRICCRCQERHTEGTCCTHVAAQPEQKCNCGYDFKRVLRSPTCPIHGDPLAAAQPEDPPPGWAPEVKRERMVVLPKVEPMDHPIGIAEDPNETHLRAHPEYPKP